MRAFRASAGVFSRLAFALLLPVTISACGDSTEPGSTADVAGLWTATISGTFFYRADGAVVDCSVTWAMSIKNAGTSDAPALYTFIPVSTKAACADGTTSDWRYRGWVLDVRQDGPGVALVTTSQLDTFVVATLSGSKMTGHAGAEFYTSATFHATRRSGTDPNLEPSLLEVGAAFPDVEIGDTLRFQSQIFDGYGAYVNGLTVAWNSTAPAVATIGADGLVRGVSSGTTTIIGTVSGLRDSATVTVLPAAAAVEILSTPDSMIVPGLYQITAVAKDAGGQTLPERRLTWESSNPAVATVSQDGVVATLAPGAVTITARSTVVSAGVTLPVLPAVAQITLGSAGTAVPIGGTLQITATTLDAQGHVLTGRPVSWFSEDGNIISVDASGLARGVMAGTVQLTATVENAAATVENATATLDLVAQMDGPLASVAAGHSHTCGLATTGHVYCWGQNTVGQLGPAATAWSSTAVLVTTAEHFASLTSRGSHSCALNQAGAAFCWGYNSFGQLGAPTSAVGAVEPVSGGIGFSRLAAGFEFTCGLASGGSAYCWGLNGKGQLGRGTDDLLTHALPAAVLGGHTFTSIAAGQATACGLTAAGEAWCWGSNEFGNLGLGTQDSGPHSTPVHAAPGLTFAVIAPSYSRTCGLTTGGVVQCWGEGQLTPAALDAASGYTELAAGQSGFCRADGSGPVSCWDDSNLGNVPLEPAAGVTVGSAHACARLVATGKVVCWGDNDAGQLGNGGYAQSEPIEPLGQP